jgi:hypothetical protein
MFTFLKNRFDDSCVLRIVIALLYGLINVTVLVNHTCYSVKENPHSCCLEDSIYQSADESRYGVGFEIELNQNGFSSTVLTHRKNCLACLYSLISKLYKLNQAIPQVFCEDAAKVRFINQLSFEKQFEWLSSAPLRAPPIFTS